MTSSPDNELYFEYIKERENKEVYLLSGLGFFIYKLHDDFIHIDDFFVIKEKRMLKHSGALIKAMYDIAYKAGVSYAVTGIDITVDGCERHMQHILHYGFIPYKAKDNGYIWFKKILKE